MLPVLPCLVLTLAAVAGAFVGTVSPIVNYREAFRTTYQARNLSHEQLFPDTLIDDPKALLFHPQYHYTLILAVVRKTASRLIDAAGKSEDLSPITAYGETVNKDLPSILRRLSRIPLEMTKDIGLIENDLIPLSETVDKLCKDRLGRNDLDDKDCSLAAQAEVDRATDHMKGPLAAELLNQYYALAQTYLLNFHQEFVLVAGKLAGFGYILHNHEKLADLAALYYKVLDAKQTLDWMNPSH